MTISRAGDGFDEGCLLIISAVKSIWLMYKRGHWELLRQIGLRRVDIEEVFKVFDAQRLGRSPGLRGQRQVLALMKAYPPVTDAAVRMTGLYMIVWANKIKEIAKHADNKSSVRRDTTRKVRSRFSSAKPV